MSAKKCAREECGKTVYPLEELKCLDKVWHKQCFKCTVCGMTLSMKNYKGYNKMPYCEPHYPKTVASVVVDTPEMRRLQENTKFQSQVKYHADFEKMKGTKIDIIDDPEMSRHKRNTAVQSNAQYHGELEKKKMQEEQRPKEEVVNNDQSTASYQTDPSKDHQKPVFDHNSSAIESGTYASTLIYSTEQGGTGFSVPQTQKAVGSIADYDPLNGNWGSINSAKTTEKLEAVLASSNGSNKTTTSPQNKKTSKTSETTGFSVRALYDYTAADKDEVSFLEGDVIVNCQKVDEGWLTGTVQRTLTWGMLPANYVEKIVVQTGRFKLT